MGIAFTLRKEGIKVIKELEKSQVEFIAKTVSDKLCSTFADYCLSKSTIYESILAVKMYVANMEGNNSRAKYFSKNNSIYFNESMDISEMSNVAIHECIHIVQELKDEKGNTIRLGLDNLYKNGSALNEAAVQIMASEVLDMSTDNVKYFNIDFNTNSPDYYPLECALVKQMAYFTSKYPLYHSALYSDDIFKNRFISITNEKTYNTIIENLDNLVYLEDELGFYTEALNYEEKLKNIKKLNLIIQNKKQEISDLFFKTQNLIIKNCFIGEFENIITLENLQDFKNKLYNFKDILGTNENYSYYNDFYCDMMVAYENKYNYILENGPINIFETNTNALAVISNTTKSISLIGRCIRKLSLMFFRKTSEINI